MPARSRHQKRLSVHETPAWRGPLRRGRLSRAFREVGEAFEWPAIQTLRRWGTRLRVTRLPAGGIFDPSTI